MRQIAGPKDMPYALRNLIESDRQYCKKDPVVRAYDSGSNFGLAWVAASAADAAAEAASGMPPWDDRLVDHLRTLSAGTGVLVLFQRGALPRLRLHPASGFRDAELSGFIAAFTQVALGDVLDGPAITVSPVIVKPDGNLHRLCTLIPLGAPAKPENQDLVTWSEILSHRRNTWMTQPDSAQFGRFAVACMLLMLEPGVTKTTKVQAARKDCTPGRPPPEIRRIDLRPMRYVKADHDSSGRQYQHRWIVRGHWRNHWHPAEGQHRPRWIAPYIKGPEGAPMLTQPKVYVWSRT